MSKVVDQKVVEMQFDNRHFERNVSTTMSTLDKLKQSLKLPEASKSLDGINRAAKNVNLSGIGSAVDTVQTKFSALQIAGVTALANITNSAVNAGKRIVKALTIDPVTTGFQEYELKMGSLKTIMAGTGESLDTVNRYLEELNKYSDQTIYSFSDMTQNIGKFTNAGVKLEDAVAAIKGISNEAALSGANANEASRAMYNFAQALSSGYVKLIDWKSIELANMATKGFKDELIKTALELKTVTKGADGMYKTLDGKTFNAISNFNDSLQDQWMTSEVLITTLKRYADSTTEIGKQATEAATKVRTFTQMMDTLKESAQSGWAKTWEILVGDYYKAEDLFTDISEAVGGFIDKMSSIRNNTLEEIFSSPWDKLTKKISESGVEMSKYEDKVRDAAKAQGISAEKFDELIKKHGSLAGAVQANAISSDILKKALEELGLITDASSTSFEEFVEGLKTIKRLLGHGSVGSDVKSLQTALEKLGHSVGECGIDGIIGPDTLAAIKEFQREAGIAVDGIAGPETLAALEKAGSKVGELEESYTDFLKDIDKKGGRELLIESFTHLLREFKKPLDAIKDAWNATFGDSNMTQRVYDLIEKIHELTTSMTISEDQANNFKKVFEGLFAAFQISNMMFSMSLNAAIKILTSVLSLFGTNIAEVAGVVSDYIVRFKEWLDKNTIFIDSFDKIAKTITEVIKGIKGCIQAFMELPQVKAVIDAVKDTLLGFFGILGKDFDGTSIDALCKMVENAFTRVKTWLSGLKDSTNLGKDLIEGLVNGITSGVQTVVQAVMDLGQRIIDAFKNVTGIHSPSKVFFVLGGFLITGLIAGLINGFPSVFETLQGFGQKCIEIVKGISLGEAIAVALSVGSLLLIKKALNILELFAAPAKGLGKMMSGLGSMFENIGESLNPKASKWTTISKAILTVALAIVALTAAAYVLGNMDTDELLKAGAAILVLSGIVAGMMILAAKLDKIGKIDDSIKYMIVITGSLLLMAFTLKKVAEVDMDNVPAALAAMLVMVAGVSAIMYAYGALVKGQNARYMGKAGTMMIRMAAALLLMTLVFKAVAKISDTDITRGIIVIGSVELLFGAMVAIVSGSGRYAGKVGLMLLEMSAAMLLMVGVIKIASKLDAETVLKGMGVIVLIEALFVAIVAVSKFAGKHAAQAGIMLFLMAGALGIITYVIKQTGELDGGQLAKGLAVIGILELFFVGLIAISKKTGPDAIKAGTMLLAVSGALLILTGAMYVLTKMDPDGLMRALGVVTVLELLFMGLIGISHFAKNCMGTLIVLTTAISMLTIAVVSLTFLDQDDLRSATEALSMVIVAFGLLIAATHYAGNMKTMGKSLIVLVGVVAVLAAIVAALSFIDTDNALETVAALSLLMISFAGAMTVMSFAGPNFTKASTAILPMLAVVAGLATILGLMSYLNVEASIPTAIALSVLLTAMSAAMVIAGVAGPKAMTSVGALALMGLVVAEIAAILGVMQHFDIAPSMDTVLALSALLLVMSGVCAIVSFIPAAAAIQGAVGLAGFVGIIGAVIAALGLLTKVEGFSEIMANGGKILGDIGYAIGGFVGNIIGGFSSGVTAGLPDIGTNLSSFMTNAQGFFDGMENVNGDMLTKVETLASAVMTLTKADFVDGINNFLGNSSLSDFGTELASLGTSMNQFVTNLGTFTEDQVTTVDCAAKALTALAQAADTIPNDGGWMESIVGGNNLETFGSKLPTLALKLHDFVTILSGFGKDQAETVKYAAEGILGLAEAATKIPNDGGWMEAIVGGNSVDTFSGKLPLLGSGIASFVANLGTFGKEQLDAVKNAASAIKALAIASTEIPNEGGWMEAIVGGNSVDTFGSKLSTLGANLASFIGSISGVDMTHVDSATAVLQAIVELVNIDFSSANTGISSFCDKMKTLASDAVDKFADKLKSYDSKTKTKSAIVELVEAAANKAGSSACVSDFKSAGKDCVDGFIAGINAKKEDAKTAAANMAAAAAAAAEAELQINSPSKVFRAIGMSVPEGFALGIDRFGNLVANSTTRMTNRALDIARHSVETIHAIMGNDMSPTISPVLDLTNVEAGASAISGMLNMGPSIGVQANVGAISTMMHRNSQNGANGDVIMAIDRLRKDLGRVGNTYNTIQGITYDDGSNVSEAVKVLVHAAKVGRRV